MLINIAALFVTWKLKANGASDGGGPESKSRIRRAAAPTIGSRARHERRPDTLTARDSKE